MQPVAIDKRRSRTDRNRRPKSLVACMGRKLRRQINRLLVHFSLVGNVRAPVTTATVAQIPSLESALFPYLRPARISPSIVASPKA